MSDSDVEVIMTMPGLRTPPPAKEASMDQEMVSPLPEQVSSITSVEEKEIFEELMGDMKRQILAVEGEAAAKEAKDNSKAPTVQPIQGDPDDHLVIDLDDDDEFDVESIKENIDISSATARPSKPKNLQSVKRVLRKMTRDELEELITQKVLECINAYSTIGVLRTKVARLVNNKDRLFQKATALQKQVAELSKSMKQITENHARNPKANQKAYIPLKFFRSVGLQVNTEQAAKVNAARLSLSGTGMRPVTAQNHNTNILSKQNSQGPNQKLMMGGNVNTANNVSNINTGGVGNSVNGTGGQGQKRVNKPTITVAELRNQVQVDPAKIPRRVGPGSAPVRPNNIRFPTQIQQQQVRGPAPGAVITLNSSGVIANGTQRVTTTTPSSNSIIDLTDDKPTTPGPTYNLVNQNGVQYRVVNQGGIPQGMQLVTSATGLHLVNSQGQTRPVVFQQSQVRPAASQQQIVQNRQPSPMNQNQQFLLRTISPLSAGSIRTTVAGIGNTIQKQRPLMMPIRSQASTTQALGPRLQSSAAGANTNSQIVIPRNQYNTPASATLVSSPSKKFILPELPQAAINGQPRRGNKEMPPRPELTLQEQTDGIVLSWTHKFGPNHAEILTYQIYACQEPLSTGVGTKPQPAAWKRVGDVKALPLPMACTLSQFTDENRYYFIVRGVDIYNRTGPFCEPANIILKKKH